MKVETRAERIERIRKEMDLAAEKAGERKRLARMLAGTTAMSRTDHNYHEGEE